MFIHSSIQQRDISFFAKIFLFLMLIMSVFLYTVYAVAPNKPDAAPDLVADSDTGESNNDSITNDNTPAFDVQCSNSGFTINLYTDNPPSQSFGTWACSGSGVLTVTGGTLADGTHNITYIETNTWSEKSEESDTLTITIDTVDPSSTITTSSPTNSNTLTGTSTDSISWVSQVEVSTNSGSSYSSATGTGEWSFDISLLEWSYWIIVVTKDVAGNVNTWSLSSFNIDHVSPSGYTVSIDQNYINLSNSWSLSFTFSGVEAWAEYYYSIDDYNDTTTDAVTNTWTVDPTGTGQVTGINVSSLTDGDLTLTFYLTDTNGNQWWNVTATVTKDTVAPTIESIKVDLGDNNSINRWNLTGTVSVQYSESMNTWSLNPSMITASGSDYFSVGSGSWSETIFTNDTYTVVLTHSGSSETIEETVTVASGAKDLVWNAEGTWATSDSFLVDTDNPVFIANPTHTVNSDEVITITWKISEDSNSKIIYGFTWSTLGESIEDISPTNGEYSYTIDELNSCTTYKYYVVSTDTSSNQVMSEIYSLTTTGCPGSAEIEAEKITSRIGDNTVSATGTLEEVQLENSSSQFLILEIPAGYSSGTTCAWTGAFFQIKQLKKEAVANALGTPSGRSYSTMYEISAFCDASTQITEFPKSIGIKLTYSDTQVGWVDESTLKIYRYNRYSGEWKELQDCDTDTANNTIKCETQKFSTFGLFGIPRENTWSSTWGGWGWGWWWGWWWGWSRYMIYQDTVDLNKPILIWPETWSSFDSSFTVKWEWESNAKISIKDSLQKEVCSTNVQTNGSWTCNISSLDQWSNVLNITQTDDSWNESQSISVTYNFTQTTQNTNTSTQEENTDETTENTEEYNTEDSNENTQEENTQEQEMIDTTNNQIVETETSNLRTKILDNWKEVKYSLERDYKTCKIIENILDKNYRAGYKTELKDLGLIINKDFREAIVQMEKVWILKWDKYKLFLPNRSITRAEFLKIILRTHCYYYDDEDTSSLEFIDVDKQDWEAKVISKALSLWIVSWDTNENWNKVFRPNDYISKIEIAKILSNMSLIKLWEDVDIPYEDVKWYWWEKYVKNLEYLDIYTPGTTDNSFNPNSSVKRKDLVKMITETIELYK